MNWRTSEAKISDGGLPNQICSSIAVDQAFEYFNSLEPKVTKDTNKIRFFSCVVKWTNKKFLLIHLIGNSSAL